MKYITKVNREIKKLEGWENSGEFTLTTYGHMRLKDLREFRDEFNKLPSQPKHIKTLIKFLKELVKEKELSKFANVYQKKAKEILTNIN